MGDTLERQWVMLRGVPRAPFKITVSALKRRLTEAGFNVPARTIQRDLVKLSRLFPLNNDTRGKPYGWSWAKGSPVFDLPGTDPQTALTLTLVEMFLVGIMPPPVKQSLDPYFKNAREVLKERPLRRWAERVRIVRSSQTLQTPVIAPEVMTVLSAALLEHRKFKVHYRKLGSEPADYEVSPIALVFRDQVGYLVCRLFDYADTRQLALHRIEKAKLLDEPAVDPKDFDLDAYIRTGNFDWPLGDKIKLVAKFDRGTAARLLETPLSDDQVVTTLDEETSLVKATVLDTGQLHWWLLGFGDRVEVLKPVSLRKRFAEIARNLARYYGS